MNDLGGWLDPLNEPNALAGPHRKGIDVAFNIIDRRRGHVAFDVASRCRNGNDVILARTLILWWTSRGFPISHGLVSKGSCRRVSPGAAIKQVLKIDRIILGGAQQALLEQIR